MGYSYNPDNSLASITYPSGRQVQQSYDGIGRLQQINDGTTTYLRGLTYNAAGEALSFNYGNGVQAAFTYNEHLELASLRYFKSGAADLLSLKYDYTSQTQAGNNGQIQAVHYCTTDPATCNEDLTKTEQFTYDPWSRLSTAVTGDAATWGLSENYDRFGNRLQQNVTAGTGPSSQVTVDPATNRVTGAGYAYDAAGNMTNDSFNGYTFDAENRVSQVTSGGTVLATYTYLGALRVQRQFGGTTAYVYSGTLPIAEYVGGSLTKEYVYSGGQLLATVDVTLGVSYRYHDHLSSRAEADASANVTRTFGHFPFGEIWYETGTASKWKFTTYERDSESGIDYADFRYYSIRLGRFMSEDILSGAPPSPESMVKFTYVLNDPINFTDPLGLTCYPDDPPKGGCPPTGPGPQGNGPFSATQGVCHSYMLDGVCQDFLFVNLLDAPPDSPDRVEVDRNQTAKRSRCDQQAKIAAGNTIMPGLGDALWNSSNVDVPQKLTSGALDSIFGLGTAFGAVSGAVSKSPMALSNIRSLTGIPMTLTKKALWVVGVAITAYNGYKAYDTYIKTYQTCMQH